mgnify:CR=1 FL=1
MLATNRMSDLAAQGGEATDYDIVRRAITHISKNWRAQPEIEQIAEASGVTPAELHHLFRRWAGLTPKAFLQAVTLDRARELLRDSASVLDASYELGLSGPGRLHDLFVTHESMSPGEWKSGGQGLTMWYGFHPSPFGTALVIVTDRGLAGLAFADAGEEKPALGRATTYSDIANCIGKPNAPRAVGAAVGRNHISFVVPCHRVLGKSGALTGYHWGITRKHAMLGWEAGAVAG